jgi:hypothetical protein
MNNHPNEPGILLGITLISILVVLFALLAGLMYVDIEPELFRPGIHSVLFGLYAIAWGVMFLASYYFSHKTFFLRGLIWVCEHWSTPASRKMAFFYFTLTLLFGVPALLTGLGIVGQ